jgi:hypothetical protein
LSRYKVLVDDNFHFMNQDYREVGGVYETAAEAIAACKEIVDDCLKPMLQPGMSCKALYRQYEQFGEDPFVRAIDPNGPPAAFTAWQYAREQCEVLCSDGSPRKDPRIGTVFPLNRPLAREFMSKVQASAVVQQWHEKQSLGYRDRAADWRYRFGAKIRDI